MLSMVIYHLCGLSNPSLNNMPITSRFLWHRKTGQFEIDFLFHMWTVKNGMNEA